VLAVQQQDPELVRLLLRHHAEPDCRTSIGRPILTEVLLAKSPVADYERGLRQGTADQQEEGLSLRDHIRDIRWTLLKELLQNGAHPDLADQGGNTPLMTASVLLELADVEALLAAGANPNAQNDRGVTPLMLTCLAIGGGKQARLTSADIVESLLKHGADPNHQSSTGESALMRAAGEDNTAAMKVLRKYGARTDLRDKEGKDALAYARANHREEAVGTIVWWRKGSRRH
jgi:ankyrin repeat protein